MPLQCRTMLCRCVTNPSHSFAQLLASPLRFTAALRDYACLCRHCSAQFSTIQCYARAKLFFASAEPFKALAPLCQSMPLHVRSVLSRTIPLPCLATLCHSPAVLFPGIALRYYSLALPYFTQMRFAKTGLLSSMHFHFPAFSVQCYAQPRLFAAMPCHCPSLHCLHNAMLFLSSSPQCIAVPVRLNALPIFSWLCPSSSFVCFACASPLLADTEHDCAIPALN